MNIRRKSIERLAIVFDVLVAVCGIAAFFVLKKQQDIRARGSQSRTEAMAAYQKKDYVTGIRRLQEYYKVSKAQETDPAALFVYGKSLYETAHDARHMLE